MDAAAAASNQANAVSPEIVELGLHRSNPIMPTMDKPVAKSGRTTKSIFSPIADLRFDGNVNFGPRAQPDLAWFENQTSIVGSTSPFSQSGDSGYLVVDSKGLHPNGLFFADDNQHTLGSY